MSDPQQNIGVVWRGETCRDFRGYLLTAVPLDGHRDGRFAWLVSAEDRRLDSRLAEGQAPNEETARRCAVAIAVVMINAGMMEPVTPPPEKLPCGCFSYTVVPQVTFQTHGQECPIKHARGFPSLG